MTPQPLPAPAPLPMPTLAEELPAVFETPEPLPAPAPAAAPEPEPVPLLAVLEEAEEAAERAKSRPRAPRSKITARTVRQIIAKHAQLDAADRGARTMLAAALGVKDDAADITAHIVRTPRIQLSGFDEIDEIIAVATSDPFEAVAKSLQLESQHRTLWGIFTGLGLVSGALPAKESVAATEIARAATRVTDEHRAVIDEVRALSRKVA